MTPAARLLERVKAAGGWLTATDEGRLRVEAATPLPDSLVAELRARKPELLVALGGAALPPPLTMKDGRQLYRVHAGRDGLATELATRIIGEAKTAHVVLVADNTELVIVAPRDHPSSLIHRVAADAADVLAALHRASDQRLGLTAISMDGPEAA